MAGAQGSPLRIGAVGFSIREQLLLRSLVHIAGMQPRAWEFVEGPPYQALFTATDIAHDPVPPDVFRFPVPVPLKSDRIALLLETLKLELPRLAVAMAPDAPASGPRPAPLAAAPSAFDDGTAVVRRLMDRTQPRFGWIDALPDTSGRLLISINPALRAWRVPGSPVAPAVREVAARLARGGLRYVDLSTDGDADAEADTHRETDGPAQRLEPLLWHVGLLVSPDGVLPQVRRTRRLRLSRWPDFGTVGSDTLQLKLSALLISRAYTIEELLLAGGGVAARPVAFLNACALCELFVSDPADDRPRALSAPRQFGSVMRMVRSALGMASA
jgi:hypothetical protein